VPARITSKKLTEKAVPTTVRNLCDLAGQVVRSESLKRVVALVERVARYPVAVLIVGETGTGKEMIARALHERSLRCNSPWIDVNCAAMPEHLVESELFGYEKGAFSGADSQKQGLFELAHRGTLFLDEIGDLDAKIQVKLLRVLDGVPYYRLGGSRKVSVDVRIVAATNQNLEELVRAGSFRSDLYHRLAQFKVEIPPLRERPDDLVGIAELVLQQHYPGSILTGDAVAKLLSYDWPGNVRQLRNCIFHAVLSAGNPAVELTANDIKLPESSAITDREVRLNRHLGQVERQMVLKALERCSGHQGKAAKALGISRRTLLRKLKSYRDPQKELESGISSGQVQRYYRAELNTDARIIDGTECLTGTLLNISLGGAGVALKKQLSFGTAVTIYFRIPTQETELRLAGQIVWSNNEGQHGVQFSDLPAELQAILKTWLDSEINGEGSCQSSTQ
jgi:transcriptional regulator with PAS, ATPase and Fis domain